MRRTIAAAVLLLLPSVAVAADWRADALADVKSEKKVIEAKFPNATTLWASMVDDGSRRDGFARYLCLSLKFAGADQSVRVRILDAAELNRGEFKTLGEYWCKVG